MLMDLKTDLLDGNLLAGSVDAFTSRSSIACCR